MAEIIKRTTIKALIEKDGKILILKDSKGVWEMPGGRRDVGETDKETLKRELDEEVGIKNPRIGSKIHKFTFEVDCKGLVYQFNVNIYMCEIEDKDLHISSEHEDIKWVDIAEIESYKMRDGYKEAITLYAREYL